MSTQTAVAPVGIDSQEAILERRSQAVIEGIEAIDPDFVLHLASSTLKIVLSHFIDGAGARPGRRVFAMPREEEGVAIAAGLELADVRPIMIFQDNGIGNLLTSLLTLSQPYHLPLLCIVTRRGGLGEYNSMIHTISERSEALLDAAGVRWFQLDAHTPIERWAVEIERAWHFARATHRPVFMLVNLMGA
ncbi:MAG: thiamine pyrophosphate-binding protein [Frankiales bacterium]|nr:thiamine pyrophosphate-binding protein [Frankiales bacterium]